MSGLVVPVVVDGWQHECCGGPIVVGGEVGWRLLLDGDTWSPATIDLAVEQEDVPQPVLDAWRDLGNRTGPDPVLIRHAGLIGYLPDRSTVQDGRVRGVLREDHHVDVPTGVPMTAGTVLRIRLVSRLYRSVRRNEFGPIEGTEELRDVKVVSRGCFYESPPTEGTEHRSTTEVLVDLAVDPG